MNVPTPKINLGNLFGNMTKMLLSGVDFMLAHQIIQIHHHFLLLNNNISFKILKEQIKEY